MTSTTPFGFDDAAVERMLQLRAGPGAPATLVPSILDAITDLPQARRLGPRLPGWGRIGPTRTLALAAVLLLTTVIAGLAVVGSGRNDEVVPPSVSPSPRATQLATRPSDEADGPRLIVLALGSGSRVEIYTLDPFTDDRVDIGILQPQAPSGQSIHWASNRRSAISFGDGDSVHALVNLDSRSISPLSLSASGGRHALSPAGDEVAYLDYPESGGVDLVVVDLAGNERFRTQLPDGIQPLSNVAWAPDASQVAVSTCVPCPDDPAPKPQHLLLVPLDGGVIRDLAAGPRGYLGYAAWAPDLSTIVVAEDGGLLGVAVETGALTELTSQPDRGQVWSPDGSRIAFTRTGSEGGLYVIDADGSNPTQLVSSPGEFSLFDLHWSPDGAWILYGDGRTDASLGDLWIVPSVGGEPRLVASNAVADW